MSGFRIRPVAAGLVLGLATLSGPAGAETIRITIDRLSFSPAHIEAKVGDRVEWVNKEVIAHTATVKGSWEVFVPAKKSGSTVLREAGAVSYFCRFHPNMTGTITVSRP